MTNNELKAQYNHVLGLIYKGSAYMDNPSVSNTDKDKAGPKFLKLIDAANKVLNELEKVEVRYTDKEILEGFGGDRN